MGRSKTVMLCVLSVCFLLLGAAMIPGNTYGRYANSTTVSVVHGGQMESVSTLSVDTAVYDFGCWNVGDNADELTHVIRLESESPLSGTLRFKWDDQTAEKNDLNVLVESIPGSEGKYSIQAENGRLEVPFSIVCTGTTRSGIAVLDVEWIPQRAEKAACSARYLLALNPTVAGSEESVVFAEETGFLSNNWLQLSLTVPETYAGVRFAPGLKLSNTFAVGTTYFTDRYPQGVTLLRDSELFLPREADGMVSAVIDTGAHTAGTPVNFVAGLSDTYSSNTSQTPTVQGTALTVELSHPAAVITAEQPLTVTLTEPAKLRDTAWNTDDGGECVLTWRVERLVDGTYVDLQTGDGLTVTAAQTTSGGTLVFDAGEGRAVPGTYRLVLNQTYRGYTVTDAAVSIFVDYR